MKISEKKRKPLNRGNSKCKGPKAGTSLYNGGVARGQVRLAWSERRKEC